MKYKRALIDTLINHNMNWAMYIVTMLLILVLGINTSVPDIRVIEIIIVFNMLGTPFIILSKSWHTYKSEKTLAEKTYELLMKIDKKL